MKHRWLLLSGVVVLILLIANFHDIHAQQSLTGTILTDANARMLPNASALVRFSLPPGFVVNVEARSHDSQWLLIRTPRGQRGWVRGRQLQVSFGLDQLPVSDESIGSAAANAAPESSSAQPSPAQSSTGGSVSAGYSLARTPPMGWNSWNHFHCNINEVLIRSMADQMVALGLKAAGYSYVIVDDCWQGKRDANGSLTADSQRFPGGMKVLAAYVHGRGLRFGIYSSRGATTCAGYPGSLGYEAQDATVFASWDVDYVKYDGCPYAMGPEESNRLLQTMAKALRASGRPVLLSIVGGGYLDWYPSMVQLNRTTGDMQDVWAVMLSRFDENAAYAAVARPGYWNDPDALEVGNGNMTLTEYRTHFSLWAISAAPLILSADLNKLDLRALNILTNAEVIAVDQDALGIQGHKISEPGPGSQVWAKRLRQDGTWAVVLLNRSQASITIPVQWKSLSPNLTSASVRNLWTQTSLGSFKDGFSAQVEPHGAVLIRVSALN